MKFTLAPCSNIRISKENSKQALLSVAKTSLSIQTTAELLGLNNRYYTLFSGSTQQVSVEVNSYNLRGNS